MAGGNIDNLYIQVSTSAKSASNSLDKLASALEKLGKLTTNSGLDKLASQLDKVTSSAGGATSALSKIKGINASIKSSTSNTNRLTGAFGSLWKMLKKVAVSVGSIALFQKGFGLATDVFETANYFRTVMGDFTEEAYAYTEKVSEALGIDESEWMKNQATFMSLAYTFGNTADSAYLMSKNLTQLVYDMSSLKDVDPTVAMQKLRSAFAGEIEPLRDWGVDLSKANLQLVALEHNITKPFDKMTQGEKSQLRYITIMNQLEYAMGDLNKTLNSPANQMRLFETAVMKLARAFGNILIPIMNKVLPVLIKITYALRDAVQAIANFLGFELPDMSSWEKFGGSVEDVADDYDNATKAAKKFKGQLAGFDEINNLTTNSPSGSGSDATGTFGNLDLPTYESLGKSFLGDALDKQIDSILTELPAKLHNFITGVTEKIKTIDWASIGQAFADGLANLGWPQLMMDLGGFIITGLNAMVQWLVGASGGLVSTGAAIVEGILSGIAQFATNFHDNIAKPLIEAIENVDWKTFGESFGDRLKEIDWVGLITDLGDLIVAGLKALGDWLLGASGGLLDTGIDIATGILLGISNIFTNIVQWIGENIVTPFINGIKSLFGIHSPSKEMEDIGEDI